MGAGRLEHVYKGDRHWQAGGAAQKGFGEVAFSLFMFPPWISIEGVWAGRPHTIKHIEL